jgi:hypothetical protein
MHPTGQWPAARRSLPDRAWGAARGADGSRIRDTGEKRRTLANAILREYPIPMVLNGCAGRSSFEPDGLACYWKSYARIFRPRRQ